MEDRLTGLEGRFNVHDAVCTERSLYTAEKVTNLNNKMDNMSKMVEEKFDKIMGMIFKAGAVLILGMGSILAAQVFGG